jgi:thiamine monophosphate synthase
LYAVLRLSFAEIEVAHRFVYAVTDRAWVGKQTLCEQVEAALKGGCTCVQLREKELSDAEFLEEAVKIHENKNENRSLRNTDGRRKKRHYYR